jgi:hypothetical protein
MTVSVGSLVLAITYNMAVVAVVIVTVILTSVYNRCAVVFIFK